MIKSFVIIALSFGSASSSITHEGLKPADRIVTDHETKRPTCDLPILVDHDFIAFDTLGCDLNGDARLDIRYGDDIPDKGYHGDCYDMGGMPFSDSEMGTHYCIGIDY